MRDNGNGAATVGRDGVTVYQSYQEERFDVPAILLEFVSERSSPVDVRASVLLPSDLRVGTVGFHPEYGRENWSVEGERLVFETGIDPDETVTTVYAVESLRADQLDALLENLSLERVSKSEDRPAADSGFDVHPSRRSDRGDGATPATGDDEESVSDLTAQVETHSSEPDGDEIEFAGVSDGGETGDSGDDPAERRNGPADAPGNGDTGAADASGPDADDLTDTETTLGSADSGELSDRLESGMVSDRPGSGDADLPDDESGSDGPESDVDADLPDDESGSDESGSGLDADDGDRVGSAGEGTGLQGYPTAELIDELDSRAGDERLTSRDRERLYSLLLSEGDATSDRMRLLHLQAQVTHLEQGMESVREFDDRHGRPAEAFADLQAELAALGDRLAAVESEVESVTERQETVESDVASLVEWRETFEDALGGLGED